MCLTIPSINNIPLSCTRIYQRRPTPSKNILHKVFPPTDLIFTTLLSLAPINIYICWPLVHYVIQSRPRFFNVLYKIKIIYFYSLQCLKLLSRTGKLRKRLGSKTFSMKISNVELIQFPTLVDGLGNYVTDLHVNLTFVYH